MCSGGPIAWCSRKQSITATSTTEAEYIAAAECCKELKYLNFMLQELTNREVKMTLYVDNQSAIKLIKSGQMNTRSRYIDVRYYFISEQFDEGLFKLEYCNTNDQIADVFTKPLLTEKYVKFRDALVTKPK